MKYIVSLFAILSFGCTNTTETPGEPEFLARISFDADSELDAWNLGSSVGVTNIDTEKVFEGKGAIHFVPKSGCYIIDRKVGIPVTENSNYKVELNVLINPAQIPNAFCAGAFILVIKQGNDELLYESFFDAPDWELKTAYFKTKNNLPITIHLIMDKEVWIDDMRFLHSI